MQQFSAYDVVVDITPGATAIVMGTLLLPADLMSQIISAPALTGVIALLVSYPIGRLIHATGSYYESHIEYFSMSTDVTSTLYRLNIWEAQGNVNIREILQGMVKMIFALLFIPGFVILTAVTDIRDVESVWDISDVDGLSVPTAVQTFKSLAREIYGDDVDSWPPVAVSFEETQLYGQSVLFSAKTLYGKYDMLTTFYRNLWIVAASVSTISILVSYWHLLIILEFEGLAAPAWIPRVFLAPPNNIGYHLLIAVFALIGGYLLGLRYTDFQERRDRAFIHDLHREFG